MIPDHQPHPLLLPNIFSRVLSHFDDTIFLQQLRLVCHTWNVCACSVLRTLRTISFNPSTLQSYLQIYSKSPSMFGILPHSDFDLKLLRVQHRDSILQFLDIFSLHIRRLHVTLRPSCGDPEYLDEILKFPQNLKHLCLNFQYFHDVPKENFSFSPEALLTLEGIVSLEVTVEGMELSEKGAPPLLQLLFGRMTNLRRISTPGDKSRLSKVGEFLKDVILHHSQDPEEVNDPSVSLLRKLEEFDFKLRLLPPDLSRLLHLGFTLRSFHVDLWNPEEDDESSVVSSSQLSELWGRWRASLQNLSVDFPFRKEVSMHFRFPCDMPNLTRLYLGGLEGSLLELLRTLRGLRRLELSQLDLQQVLRTRAAEDICPHEQLESLRLDFCTGQTGGIMSRLSRLFPKLRCLNVNKATDEVARVVFDKMRGLLRLRLHGDELTDAGICGFSGWEMKEYDFMRMGVAEGRKYRKYKCISDLKELQYLRLDAFGLTELTVRHGLVHCVSLRIVKLDCTGGSRDTGTTCRTFRLAEYGNHFVESEGSDENPLANVIEMTQDPPLEEEAELFFSSRYPCDDD